MALLLTLWSSLFTKTDAFPAAMLSGEISTQSQVSSKSSPIRREQAKDKLMDSFRRSSSHNSVARNSVGASQISRFFVSAFGTVAYIAGFFSMSSHFTAW